MPKRKNEASNFNGLPFKEITTRLGPDELVKRLKACLNYIEGVNELPTTSIQSFIDLSYTLISHSIKDHKSKDVKLLAACILIKVHQLLNLESPTNEESLKEMCELFISQLDHVKKSSSPLYNWAFTLLELLASTKFFVCCHVLEKQDILVDLIQKIYTIINHDQTSQVHHYLLDIATGVIQAAEHLPDQLLDAILLPVVEEEIHLQRKLIVSSAPSGLPLTSVLINSDTSVVYDFAQHLIKRSSQYLQPFIQTFFTSVMIIGEESQSQLCQYSYKLIQELYKIDSYILLSVLPQLETKLKSSEVDERLSVTDMLGEMFSAKGSQLSSENKPLWICYIARYQDINVNVRLKCVKFSRYFLINHPNLSTDISEKLMDRLQDTEEKVRMESVKAICETAIKDISAVSEELLLALMERMRDKKWPLRKYTINSLAVLYNAIVKSDLSVKTLKKISWIPNKILHSFYQPYTDDRLCIMKCLYTSLLPIDMEPHDKTERLLVMYDCLDTNAINAFVKLLNTQKMYTGDSFKTLLGMTNTCLMDGEAIKDLTCRVVKGILEPSLSYTDEQEKHELNKCIKGVHCLKIFSDFDSLLFHNEETLEELLSLMRHTDASVVEDVMLIMSNIGKSLTDQFNQVASCLQPLLTQMALKSSYPVLARGAVRCISSLYTEQKYIFERLYESLVSSLDMSHPHLESILSSLSEMALLHYKVFEKRRNAVVNDFIVKRILDKDYELEEQEVTDDDILWCDESEVSCDTKLKIVSMELLVSWIKGFPPDKASERRRAVVPILKLLSSTLMDKGDLYRKNSVKMSERARLRLAAANSLLMLASSLPDINEIMTLEQFLYLALTIQDPCDEVRDGFVAKLGKFVITQTLSLRYISIFCLSPAVETRKTAKAEIKSMLSEAVQVRRKYYTSNPSAKDNYTNILPEYSLSFAVYLLSHHPSFDRSNVKILELFRDCLWFYLEPLLYKTDNFNFLQQTLISIKQLKDSQHPDDDEVNKNIYAICDLALGILINKIGKTTVGDNFPGEEVTFPKHLFIPNKKGAHPNNNNYLPVDYQIYPDKVSKMDALLKTPAPQRKGRGSKKPVTNGDVVNTSSESIDTVPSTSPDKRKKRRNNTTTSSSSISSKATLNKKQGKLPFKPKGTSLMTSTPVTSRNNIKTTITRSTRQNTKKQLQVVHKVETTNEENGADDDDDNDGGRDNEMEVETTEMTTIHVNESATPMRRTSPRKRPASSSVANGNPPDEEHKKMKIDKNPSLVIKKVKQSRKR